MKKFIALMLALVLALSLVACGEEKDPVSDNTSNNSNNTGETTVNNEQNQPEETEGGNDAPVVFGEISLDDVMKAPVNPESDFVCMEMNEGEALLMEYHGSSEIVVLPETWNGMKIVEVSQYMFNNDSPVKAIRLSDSVRKIGICAFSHNESLEIFVSGKGLEEITEAVFQNCTNLKEVVLNDGLVTLGRYCLSGSDHLTSIEIPASVTDIAKTAFYSSVDGFTIIGEAGSVAEEFANTEGIAFEAK